MKHAAAVLSSIWITSSAPAAAQTLHVTLDARAQALLGVSGRQLESEIAKQTQALVGANLGSLLDDAARTQALVHAGLGADYASDPDGLILGAALGLSTGTGVALDVASSGSITSVPATAGAQLTLMVGYNLASAGVPDLTLFAHGMGAPFSFSELEGSFWNFGASAQYRIVGPRGTPMLGWGGLDITGGVSVSRTSLTIVATDVPMLDTTIGGVQVEGTSSGSVNLVEHAISFPIELTTSVTALHFLTLYGGVGADFNTGAANLVVDLDTTVTPTAGGPSGSAQAILEQAGAPDTFAFRLIAGAQTNFGPVKLFAQVNVLPEQDQLSLATGARVVF